MLMLLSPAKSLDMQRSIAAPAKLITQPQFLDDTALLTKTLKAKSVAQIKALMGVSDALAELNFNRFQTFDSQDSSPALAAFDGDVYAGLDAASMSAAEITYAQKHLRILSGLYGLLRPLDAMRPYRLEMGTKLANKRGEDLYDFWGERLAVAINEAASTAKASHIVNLASNEYFKAARAKSLALPIITPQFKERSGGQVKMISFFAKKARGTMARWIIENRVERADDLRDFAQDGYRFESANPTKGEILFVRG